MPATADVIVVGGGAIGCAIARAVARDGQRVILCEAGPEPAQEASAAAAGVINAQGERHTGAFLDLCLASRERFADFVRTVEAESGIDTEFAVVGFCELALTAADDARLDAWAARQQAAGASYERWDAARVRQANPALASAVRGGLYLPEESAVDCRLLGRAIAAAAVRAGVDLRCATPVEALHIDQGRVTGVQTAAGESLHAERVVVAAGAWSSLGAALPFLPVRPAKGQMLALHQPEVRLAHPVVSGGIYLVARPDGRCLVGATVEDVGFDKANTAAGVQWLLAGAMELCPDLAAGTLLEQWAGLRPRTPDDWPILGPTPIAGLLAATGHFRNGMLLTPLTAELLASWCRGDTPAMDVTPFSASRFDGAMAGATGQEG